MNEHPGCALATIAIIVGIATIGGCFGFFNKHVMGNKQIIDFRQTFNVAYIDIPGDKPIKVHVSKWNDYDKSDSIQIIDNAGKVYYTHLNRVVLTQE